MFSKYFNALGGPFTLSDFLVTITGKTGEGAGRASWLSPFTSRGLDFSRLDNGTQAPYINSFEITDHVESYATPNDPLFPQQWHLTGANGVNVSGVRDEYTGQGITIGFVDDGIEYTHPDLNDNYDASIDFDMANNSSDGGPKSTSDRHATSTSGMAAAEGDNGLGVTGVAYDATLTSYRIPFGSSIGDAQLAGVFNRQVNDVDISNNSWGFGGFFSDNFKTGWSNLRSAIQNLAEDGREGLGTVLVFAAGNGRTSGDNTNYHNLQNSKYAIAVAATDSNGKYTDFSTPGASVLVSAPGLDLISTDRQGSAGYVNGDYVGGLAGTSFSTPIVSGLVALMLEANPLLGYRDVQEILAYSSRNSDPSHSGWQINGAENWNGGGAHFSHDYGFGLVDAHAALRLAESWQEQQTAANMSVLNSGNLNVNANIPDNNANGVVRNFTFNSDLDIEKIEIDVNITHTWIGDLRIVLTSPDGTVSTLVNRPGVNPDAPSGSGSSADNINFTFSSNAFWGEQAIGAWSLRVMDVDPSFAGKLNSWSIRAYGDAVDNNDTYVYTDEFSNYANAARTSLVDAAGTDTINAAAVTSHTTLSLLSGATSTIDGVTLTLGGSTVIENAFLGDGDDSALGNGIANQIHGGRGDDTVQGAAGDDSLTGGAGEDTAVYEGDFSDFLITILNSVTLTIADQNAGDGHEGTDWVQDVENFLFGGVSYLFNGAGLTPEDGTPPPPPPANENPLAGNDAATTDEDQAVTIDVLANDDDPDADDNLLSVSAILDAPDHGDAVINPDKTVTYTPDAGWFGVDTFTYEVRDADGGTDIGEVTVTVNEIAPPPPPVNQSPDAQNDNANTAQDEAIVINVLGNDSDPDEGDALSVSGIADAPDHGGVVVNADNTITYTPDAGWTGTDTFIYEISDGDGAKDTALVTVNVDPAQGMLINDNGVARLLVGGAGNDTINAGAGNDTVDARGGDDTIDGGVGNDLILGGDGNDSIYSGIGSDTIVGGHGADVLEGYKYSNTVFLYEEMADAGDTINGFVRGKHVIDLRELFDDIGYSGNNPIAGGWMQIGAGGGNVTISIDADGVGGSFGFSPLVTLAGVNFTTLTLGTDYWV